MNQEEREERSPEAEIDYSMRPEEKRVIFAAAAFMGLLAGKYVPPDNSEWLTNRALGIADEMVRKSK